MELRVAAISDLHGHLPEMTEPADILLLAGDAVPLDYQFDKPKSKKWFETTFANWVKELPVDKVFMIAGNHDAYLENIKHSNVLSLQQSCRKLTYLDNEVSHYYDNNAQLWSMFGTPYCRIFNKWSFNWSFTKDNDILTKKFIEIPDKVDIIISHDPPFAFGDADVILETRQNSRMRHFEHLGNKPLADRLKDVEYKLIVCGHIHSGDHSFNETFKIANVSLRNENYVISHPIFYTTITK